MIFDLRQDMRQKLETAEARALYETRKTTVEPVFGQIKQNRGFRRFALRGLAGAAAEVYLVATAHNLMKWIAARAAHIASSLFRRRIQTLACAA